MLLLDGGMTSVIGVDRYSFTGNLQRARASPVESLYVRVPESRTPPAGGRDMDL